MPLDCVVVCWRIGWSGGRIGQSVELVGRYDAEEEKASRPRTQQQEVLVSRSRRRNAHICQVEGW